MDAPEPQWKYLSGFAVQKGQPKTRTTGPLGDLLAPRRGPTTAPPLATATEDLSTQQQQPITNEDTGDVAPVDIESPTPVATQPPTQQAPAQAPQDSAVRQTRSGRVVTNTPRYDQSMRPRSQGLVAWEVLMDQDKREDVPTASSQYAIQKALEDPIAFSASCNPDILYWDQAMKAPDRDKFIEAVGIELDGHERMGNYEPIPLCNLPKGTKLIDMVWSMQCKRRINTQEVYKWKAHLNVHGGQQGHSMHYWDTYAPVVTWQTVRLFLIISLLLGWQNRQLDFVMAYPQAPAEMPLYMRLPQGYKHRGMSRKTHALKLIRNVYGQKQAGRVWNKFMDKGMRDIGFTPSAFDPCLYYRGSVLFLVYIDDCIMFRPDAGAIDQVVTDLRSCPQQFTVDDQGDVGDFLGIQIKRHTDGSVHLSQPQLIDSIIKDLHLQANSNPKSTPAVTSTLLHKDTDGPDMLPKFHYCSVIGNLNFLEKSTRPDISVSIHQCACFSDSPKKSHAEAVKRIGCYLLAMRDKGLVIHPYKDWHFDCWVDADFAGNWRQADAHLD